MDELRYVIYLLINGWLINVVVQFLGQPFVWGLLANCKVVSGLLCCKKTKSGFCAEHKGLLSLFALVLLFAIALFVDVYFLQLDIFSLNAYVIDLSSAFQVAWNLIAKPWIFYHVLHHFFTCRCSSKSCADKE